MTDGIADFLTARYDEDEAIARMAAPRWFPSPAWAYDPKTFRVTLCGTAWTVVPSVDRARGPHIAYWHPGRVLADIAAKRRLLRWCVEEVLDGIDLHGMGEPGWVNRVSPDRTRDVAIFTAAFTLKTLAAPYADHPDYDPAWRIDA